MKASHSQMNFEAIEINFERICDPASLPSYRMGHLNLKLNYYLENEVCFCPNKTSMLDQCAPDTHFSNNESVL